MRGRRPGVRERRAQCGLGQVGKSAGRGVTMPQACFVSRAWVRNTFVMPTLGLSILTFKPNPSCLMLSRNGEE